ncbi:MAG TPA: ABC transporter ATP-binding protein [Candidatus Woesebacteria bacterium]|nr:ABC transporter ATP-binding protein [Candidatus Woesebacteria bacterium]
MDVLKVKNLTKQFGNFVAVNNISFSLKEGEILGLLGPNGAGKTTTIQMLLGVLTPTSGDIVYFGKHFKTHREEILNKVNFSTTYTNLPWNLSVRENLTYTSYLYEITDRKKRINELIELFRLQEIIEQPISELSAGQMTRVNIAKAFINKPNVLLLDEPTASLDPEIATFIRQFIVSQSAEKKVSIIFTSHNMAEVEEVCDRILFINNGGIVANDTPKNLMQSMNISHLKLKIDNKNEKILFDYGRNINRGIMFEDKEYKIDLEEKEIPGLLAHLYKSDVFIYEINIERPNLEDYFLTIAKDNRNKEA